MRYDPFQERAIGYINEGHSVIVAAPTGAGKTAIAEHVIQTCLDEGKKVIYTAPIKALSNQKYRDFSKDYPDKVGILTGDVTINPHAPTLIMTTEIFRNKILEERSDLANYAWIIFDELHYLDDQERGSVWEESLMFLPEHMNVLGLSATIPNIHQICDWLKSIHNRTVKVVIEKNRPVPLHFYFQCQNKIYDDLTKVNKHLSNKIRRVRFNRRYRDKNSAHIIPNNPNDLLEYLKAHDLLPCIYFSFGRRRTEALAKEMTDFNLLTEDEKVKISKLYDELCTKFDITNEPTTQELKPLVEKGIAFHHAGMLPTLKEVIERLFTTKLIKAIFTTETFALGINMPARSVAFDELRKIYGDNFKPLKTRDFYQMAGRAGRRGIDQTGSVFLRVNPFDVTYPDIERMIYGEPERVASRFNTSYATVLNLYAKHGEALYDIYPLSFHYFQERQQEHRHAINLMHAKVKILKELGHIRKNQVTQKGFFASKVYGYELLLSELYVQDILEHLSVTELGVLTTAIVFEPRKDTRATHLSPLAKKLEKTTNGIIFPINKVEHSLHIKPFSKACQFHLSNAVEGWMRGETFDKILRTTQADEGEVVRYFRMSIQILREILDAHISDSLKGKIYKTIERINRDVVDAEKQLRA